MAVHHATPEGLAEGDVAWHNHIGCVGTVLGFTEVESENCARVNLGDSEETWALCFAEKIPCLLNADAVTAAIAHFEKPETVIGGKLFWDEIEDRCDVIGEMLVLAGVPKLRMIERDYNNDWAMVRHYGIRPEEMVALLRINDEAPSVEDRKRQVVEYLNNLLARARTVSV